MSTPARILFFGTAEIACPTLAALHADPRFELVAVVTQPDRPKGRSLQLSPSAVKAMALPWGVPILQPAKARDPGFIREIAAFGAAAGVVFAYGQILPQSLLDSTTHGFVNVHTSLLPRHRGAAPIQWAILDGDPVSGVTIMKMDAGLDTGPTLDRSVTPLAPDETAQTLHDRLAILGAGLLPDTLHRLLLNQVTPVPQPADGTTYARKITKEDGRIEWDADAAVIDRRRRAFTPWPGMYTSVNLGGKTKLLKIHEARVAPGKTGVPGTVLEAENNAIVVACGSGALELLRVQLEGGRPLSAAEFLAGHPLHEGDPVGG